MSSYLLIKHTHSGFAYLSVFLFVVRGLLMFAKQTTILNIKFFKILPHVIDTLLLVSAFMLLYTAGWPFFKSPWLIAKTLALFAYIGFGLIALKYGRNLKIKGLFFMLALASVIYIILVAKTKMIFPF